MSYKCVIEKSQEQLLLCQYGFMGISIGSHEQSGRKLSAIIDFVIEYFYEKPFTFYLCDSLRGHNIAATANKISLLEARKQAIYKADLWLADNKKYFDNLNSNHIIKRWDEYLYDPKYLDAWHYIKDLYEYDLSFRKIVLRDVSDHIDRIKKVKDIELDDRKLNSLKYHSVNYLLEECAGLAIAFNVGNYNNVIEFYPGNLAQCLGYFEGRSLPLYLNSLSRRRTVNIQFIAIN